MTDDDQMSGFLNDVVDNQGALQSLNVSIDAVNDDIAVSNNVIDMQDRDIDRKKQSLLTKHKMLEVLEEKIAYKQRIFHSLSAGILALIILICAYYLYENKK
jgi:hypothetical protein